MKSTHPITYVYDFEGHTIEVTRDHCGTAYAANGNVGNPLPRQDLSLTASRSAP